MKYLRENRFVQFSIIGFVIMIIIIMTISTFLAARFTRTIELLETHDGAMTTGTLQPGDSHTISNIVTDMENLRIIAGTAIGGSFVVFYLSLVSIVYRGTTASKQAEEALEKNRRELELRVEERTVDLSNANTTLQEEITERKQTETLLRESEERYRSLFDDIPVGVYRSTPSGQFLNANRALVEILGHPERASLLATNAVDTYVHPEDRVRWQTLLEQEGSVRDFEVLRRRRDGTVMWVRNNARAIQDEADRTIYYEGVVEDITERKQAQQALKKAHDDLELRVEERTTALSNAITSLKKEIAERERAELELRESEKLLDLFFSLSLDGFFFMMLDEAVKWDDTTDKDQTLEYIFAHQRITKVNDAMLTQYGGTLEEYLGLTPNDLFAAGIVQGKATWRQFLDDGQTYFERLTQKLDGTPMWIEGNYICLYDEQGQITGHFGAERDITERKNAEEEIRRLNTGLEQRVIERTAQFKAAINELEAFGYTISHDLRAPLRAMNGFAGILLQDYAPQLDPEAQRYLRLVRDNARQMGNLVDDLLTFSRLGRRPIVKQTIASAQLVRLVFEDLRSEHEERQIEFTLGKLPPCQADRALLKQVFANLLGNALKFTASRKVARIVVGHQESNGESVYFVKDNGMGFEMQYAHKLFGVFQRLHRAEDYEGTGVGLAIVQRIIVRHGGRVWAKAAPDRGATFYFTLPATSRTTLRESRSHG